MKKDKRMLTYLGLAAMVLALVLLVFSFVSNDDGAASASGEIALDPDVYSDKMEREVVDLCEDIVGIGKVSAVVSLSGGYRSVYEKDSQNTSSGYKNSTVLIGNGSSEGAVLVCYENPEISGIGIVLNCKESDAVKNSIISLVSAAFNVKKNKIYVAFGYQ